jgi:molybdate transport system substrate-binding protein
MLGKLLALAVCAAAWTGASATESGSKPLTVLAAASLTNVLGELGNEFTKSQGIPVRFSFAASSTLARQIESGAPADLFVSADHDLLSNRLALIAPADSKVDLRVERGFALAAALGGGRLSTGDPDNVPVGRYARSALMSLGVWNDVADRLVRAEDVRTALAFVARGEAPLGIVYETDARIDKKVRLVALFPEYSHPRITYPMALTTDAGPEAARLAEFLRSDASRAVFERFGFVVLR